MCVCVCIQCMDGSVEGTDCWSKQHSYCLSAFALSSLSYRPGVVMFMACLKFHDPQDVLKLVLFWNKILETVTSLLSFQEEQACEDSRTHWFQYNPALSEQGWPSLLACVWLLPSRLMEPLMVSPHPYLHKVSKSILGAKICTYLDRT